MLASSKLDNNLLESITQENVKSKKLIGELLDEKSKLEIQKINTEKLIATANHQYKI